MKKLSLKGKRLKMIREQLKARGITDKRVLYAMKIVPREKFLPVNFKEKAYDDEPIPIGFGQTISQPYTVAFICQSAEINEEDNVLEIGTGSGYETAILGMLAKKVTSVEIFPLLALGAETALKELKYRNVKVSSVNGVEGYPKNAPYDCIICSASIMVMPEQWAQQLAEGGRIIYPKTTGVTQKLVRVTKVKGNLIEEPIGDFLFVPLIY
ncbi:protein-L-isoaspartate(D-aspartate) O-methyltransferase [Candidatus Dojkabacteria bacterium]|nr:protein-L-isoaspartate(D-aspartate) O-methyltransferase [Candidatus Dojkabacteria bacterium]